MKRILRWIPTLIVVAGIWYFSDQPSLKSDFSQVMDIFLRKGAHMLEYLILFVCIFWAYLPQKVATLTRDNLHHLMLQTWTTALIFALLDEWHQSWIPGRTATPHDIGYDSLGFLLGYMLLFAYWWWKNTSPNSLEK